MVAAGGMTGVPACGVIEWLAKAGITAGYPDGEFHADDAVNRQAMAAFFHRLSALTSH